MLINYYLFSHFELLNITASFWVTHIILCDNIVLSWKFVLYLFSKSHFNVAQFTTRVVLSIYFVRSVLLDMQISNIIMWTYNLTFKLIVIFLIICLEISFCWTAIYSSLFFIVAIEVNLHLPYDVICMTFLINHNDIIAILSNRISEKIETSQVKFIFMTTFKMRKRNQQKTIQSPSQPYLYSITLNNHKCNLRWQ